MVNTENQEFVREGRNIIVKNVEITTCNSMYEDGECIGGYHEIHNIKYLQNVNHLIATIDSIVRNNLLYGCEDTVLNSVLVSCSDRSIVDELNKHYNGFCGKVKIEVEFIFIS